MIGQLLDFVYKHTIRIEDLLENRYSSVYLGINDGN